MPRTIAVELGVVVIGGTLARSSVATIRSITILARALALGLADALVACLDGVGRRHVDVDAGHRIGVAARRDLRFRGSCQDRGCQGDDECVRPAGWQHCGSPAIGYVRGPLSSTNEPGLNHDAPPRKQLDEKQLDGKQPADQPRDHNRPPLTYKDAGVDIDAGDALVERIKPFARSTDRTGVMVSGRFAGLCALAAGSTIRCWSAAPMAWAPSSSSRATWHARYGRHRPGRDVRQRPWSSRRAPLFFLDYFASGKLDVDRSPRGRRHRGRLPRAGCALSVARRRRSRHVSRGRVRPRRLRCGRGRALACCRRRVRVGRRRAVASSGPHSNGYSLARRMLERSGLGYDGRAFGTTLGEALLKPTDLRRAVAAIRAPAPCTRCRTSPAAACRAMCHAACPRACVLASTPGSGPRLPPSAGCARSVACRPGTCCAPSTAASA